MGSIMVSNRSGTTLYPISQLVHSEHPQEQTLPGSRVPSSAGMKQRLFIVDNLFDRYASGGNYMEHEDAAMGQLDGGIAHEGLHL